MHHTSITLVGAALVGSVFAASKRGFAVNDDIDLSGFTDTYNGDDREIIWQYNWDSDTTNKQSYAEYVPMLWGTASDHTTEWAAHVEKWLDEGTTHIMAFNEPELSSQADLTVAEAVTAFKKYLTPYADDALLGAPAVSNDGYTWITEFLGNCTDCSIHFVPIHWYNPYTDVDDFENWVTKICDLGYYVWITEFEGEGTIAEQQEFLEEVIPWLAANDCVTHYSYFGLADNDSDMLSSDGVTPSALGYYYAYTPLPD